MRKSLIAQSVAAVISSLGLVAAANAAVVGPAAAGAVTVVDSLSAAIGDQVHREATQLVVNTDNLGHINLVPYYSVQNGNDTYVNIVNTDTRNGKAVKVRFRGASNSDDVFDFTVLMSPGDKFAFAVTKDADSGLPKIALGDKSCTLGGTTGTGINAINGEKFVTSRLKPSLTADQKANETREGYVEILNMADIPPKTATTSLFWAIKHVNGVAPCGSATAATRDAAATILANSVGVNPTTYADAQSKGLEVPTTGLMTNWTLINVAKTLTYTGAGVAVEGRGAPAAGTGLVPGYGNIVLHAQNANTPADAADVLSSDPVLRQVGFPFANYDFPDLSTPYLRSDLTAGVLTGNTAAVAQAQRLSTSLAKDSVANEFVTVASLKAKTDWVFSMPTRRYNVAMAYKDSISTGSPATDTIRYTNFGAGLNFFDATNTAAGAGIDGEPAYQICVTGLTFQAASANALAQANRNGAATLDSEENAANLTASLPPFVISPNSPSTPSVLKFCGEVSVFKFNADLADPSAVGANVAVRSLGTAASPLPFDAGWMRLATPGLTGTAHTAVTGGTTNGLPIVGSALTKLENGAAAAGVSGNYGQSFEHRSTRP